MAEKFGRSWARNGLRVWEQDLTWVVDLKNMLPRVTKKDPSGGKDENI